MHNRKHKQYLARGMLRNETQVFFGPFRSYDKAQEVADDLVDGDFDDADVVDLDVYRPRDSKWWHTVTFRS